MFLKGNVVPALN